MNKNAEQHLAKARDYVARGEEFYRKAAAEIVAAQEADQTLSNREIGEWFERSEKWVREIVRWSTSSARASTPFGGEEYADAQAQRHTKRVLRDSTPEQVEEIVASLPPETVAKIAKAVSQEYERRGQETKRQSEKAFREEIGDAFADDLAEEQRLRDAEAKVFEARRALRDALALLNDADLDAMRDSWREDLLKTVDDVVMRADVLRSLLGGTLDEAIDKFLSEV